MNTYLNLDLHDLPKQYTLLNDLSSLNPPNTQIYKEQTYTLLGNAEEKLNIHYSLWTIIVNLARTLFALENEYKFLEFWTGKRTVVLYSSQFLFNKVLADQGDAQAQDHVGEIYYFGRGVEKSHIKAGEYFRLAADQGNAQARYHLGMIYYHGRGVEKSHIEALKYLRLASDQGSVDAQLNLGYLYRYGRGVEKSDQEAVKYFRLAANQGSIKAQVMLDLIEVLPHSNKC